jgi:dTDP-4-amino-4,6-dideoxygalactose transaminase
MFNRRINVTESFIPPMKDYTKYLQKAFDSKWLTNRGQLTIDLEDRLREYLCLNNILLTTNGTIPIQIALKLLADKGNVITTPFSYIATASTIIWENCSPTFVDIDPDFLTIDESQIESNITPNTKAILVTHVFGNPCNIDVIEQIARKHKLFVIYDAAHCFGVKYNGKSIFNYGDISTCSFHATKLFHCGEGGAIICNNKDFTEKVFYSHNFGHDGPLSFHGLGINGKISELQSAMGHAVLDNMSNIIQARKKVVNLYRINLENPNIKFLKIREGTEWNYSYFPIILNDENTLKKIEDLLNKEGVFPRRYFYPSLNTIEYLKGPRMPISESISTRILCLPLFAGLTQKEVNSISSLILKCL